MEKIQIAGSRDVFFVPTVNFDAQKQVCSIEGESFLEATVEFYHPLEEWLEKYFTEINKPLTFNFKLTYFNTGSSKSILDILYLLKQYKETGGEVTINWYYDVEDNDIIEEVEDYINDIQIKINLIEF